MEVSQFVQPEVTKLQLQQTVNKLAQALGDKAGESGFKKDGRIARALEGRKHEWGCYPV